MVSAQSPCVRFYTTRAFSTWLDDGRCRTVNLPLVMAARGIYREKRRPRQDTTRGERPRQLKEVESPPPVERRKETRKWRGRTSRTLRGKLWARKTERVVTCTPLRLAFDRDELVSVSNRLSFAQHRVIPLLSSHNIKLSLVFYSFLVVAQHICRSDKHFVELEK